MKVNMKKFLLITLITLFSFGSFAKSDLRKVNTVYTNIPVKLLIKKDTIFDVKCDSKYIKFNVVNDTVLKINYNYGYDINDDVPVIKIKTPRTLNVEFSRYLKIHN